MDKVIGLDDVRAELVIVKTPGGSGKLELIKFQRLSTRRALFPQCPPGARTAFHLGKRAGDVLLDLAQRSDSV